MGNIYKSIKKYASEHKFIFTVFIIVILYFAYWIYGTITAVPVQTKYVVSSAQKGNLVVSLSGSGQVSATTQIDIKPKVSGDIVYIGAKSGDYVRAGALLVQLNDKDAQKSVRDAEVNLDGAKIALAKLKQPADQLSLTQAENSLALSKNNVAKAYDDGFTDVSNAFIDLPTVMTGLKDLLYGSTVSKGTQDNISAYTDMVINYETGVTVFKNDAAVKYTAAVDAYNKAYTDYKLTNRFDDPSAIQKTIDETYEATKSISEAIKSTNNLLFFVKDTLAGRYLNTPAILTTHLSTLSGYISQTNTDLQSMSSAKSTIISSNFTFTTDTQSLAKLKAGADQLDIDSENLTLSQRQNSLTDAQNTLADYYIRAPFDGTVAKISINKFDSVSPSTAIATMVTKQQIATISLNEVDATKIKTGQKANLTFDAVDGLTISGSVLTVDTVGTVAQGVVTYSLTIGFDTQDNRIKPGMSANASIITDIAQDAIIVPSSAIKSVGNNYYVEVFDNKLAESPQGVVSSTLPHQQAVEIGLSNDTSTQIISGLKEGDQVVSRTITPTTKVTTQTTSATSLLGGGGAARPNAGGGAIRGN
jgi:HlyD family secretion protein